MYTKTQNALPDPKGGIEIRKKWYKLNAHCESLLENKKKIKIKTCVTILKDLLSICDMPNWISLITSSTSPLINQLDFRYNSISHGLFISIFQLINDPK